MKRRSIARPVAPAQCLDLRGTCAMHAVQQSWHTSMRGCVVCGAASACVVWGRRMAGQGGGGGGIAPWVHGHGGHGVRADAHAGENTHMGMRAVGQRGLLCVDSYVHVGRTAPVAHMLKRRIGVCRRRNAVGSLCTGLGRGARGVGAPKAKRCGGRRGQRAPRAWRPVFVLLTATARPLHHGRRFPEWQV